MQSSHLQNLPVKHMACKSSLFQLTACVWEVIHIYVELQYHYSLVTIPEEKAMSWHKVNELVAHSKQVRIHGRKQSSHMSDKLQPILASKS